MQGLEVKSESGTFQINSQTRVTAFLRKGTVTTSLKQIDSGEWIKTYAQISANLSTEILAFSSEYKCNILSSNGGIVEIGCESEVPVQVSYWVFGKGVTTSNQGVQVFDGNGENFENLLYDSSWIPIKPLSIISAGVTNAGIGSFAVVPMNVQSLIRRQSITNASGRTDHLYTRTDQAVSISPTNQIEASNRVIEEYRLTELSSTNPVGTTEYTAENNTPTKYILIDVSGL